MKIVSCEGYGNDFFELLKDTKVIWHVLTPISRDIINSAPQLRLIQKIGVGVNTIDLEAAKDNSIIVSNMPGTNSRAVAEMTILLMMASLRRLTFLDRACHSGQGWGLDPAVFDKVSELCGKRVGLVGNGAVPGILKPILESFGASVLYTDRSTPAGTDAQWRSLKDLLIEVDILSLHIPLTSETEKVIGAAELKLLKKGSILINTARGELVDEEALIQCLEDGHLSAAGLDVFINEPITQNNKLLEFDNVITTPHIAWLTEETFTRSFNIAMQNCKLLQSNSPILHRVV